MEEKKETFTYTYSAVQQEEIKRIRAKYVPSAQTEDKMERLRRLDREATKPGRIASFDHRHRWNAHHGGRDVLYNGMG